LIKYIHQQLKETLCVASENTTKSTISSHHDIHNLASRNMQTSKKVRKELVPEVVATRSKASSISSISKLQIDESSADCSKIEFIAPHTDKLSPEHYGNMMCKPSSTKHASKIKYFGINCRVPKPLHDPSSILSQPSIMNPEKTIRLPLHSITKPEILRTLINGCTQRTRSSFRATINIL
jgi:hypothetical protein